MKKKISIIILCVFCLFFKLFSQNTDTIKISLKLPYSVYFDSPCFTIIDCFDTIYQSVDTLFLVFPDIRRFDSRGEFRPSLEDTSIFPITKDDSAKRYGYYVENVYHINKHIIKRFNIKLSIPPYYANYTVLGIRFPYRDEICFFKQERKYKYKYLGKKNLSENKFTLSQGIKIFRAQCKYT